MEVGTGSKRRFLKHIKSRIKEKIKSHICDEPTEIETEKKLDLAPPLDLAPLDALLEHFEESPIVPRSMKYTLVDLAILKALLMDPPQQNVEDGILNRLEYLASKVGSIISSFDLEKMDQHMANELDSQIFLPLRPMGGLNYCQWFYYEWPSTIHFPRTGQLGFVDHLVENLKELVRGKAGSNAPLKFFILRLQGKLQFVNSRLIGLPEPRKEEEDLKDLTESITNLAYEAEYAIDSFLVRNIPIWLCVYRFRSILRELSHYKRRVKLDTGGDAQSILSSIINISSDELSIIPIVHNTEIKENLKEVFNFYMPLEIRTRTSVSSYQERRKKVFLELLDNATFGRAGIPRSGELVKKAYSSDMSEDELKESVRELLKDQSYFIILEDVPDVGALNDILRVLPNDRNRSRVLLTTRSPELVVHCRYGPQKSLFNKVPKDRTSTSQTNKPTIDNDVVGFEAETERMLEQLIGESEQLRIISIFGMGGQGKTTLAKKLYNDLSVVDYFHTRAWCYVSQVYDKKKLLLELLSQLVQLSDSIRHKNDEELAAMLFQQLVGRRFLIVLDDIWSMSAWNDLRRCFPNEQNNSRIIFTTRLQGLASQAQPGSKEQPLGLLSDDESWELLRKKLFKNESCPPELRGVGTQIAKICKGLPLSVILTAGLLAKMEKDKDWWKHIAESLSSHILEDAEAQGKGVIELSYKHLPDHLKPCFLYFGAFLKDKEVPVRKLVRLWTAEGFLKYTDLNSLEDVGEDYLTELIRRSLVTVAQEKSKGGVKSCHIHDLLRDFCLTKAKEENFLQFINGYDERFSFSIDNLDSNHSYSSAPKIYHLRRLCIYSSGNHFIVLKPCGQLVRSLLFLAANDMRPSYPYDISFISHNFKLLRILDLEDINIGDSFKAIDVLVLLRYLAIQGYVDFIPSSIANLWNLESFLFKGLRAKVVKVPNSIWDMKKLRHMHINESASFSLDLHRLQNSSMLDDLQTFSTPSVAYGDDMEKIIRKLRGIRKLKCIFLDSWDDARNCNKFPELEVLSQLESLKVSYNGEGKFPCAFNFPSNLKKLTLSNFRMPWDEFSQLVTLCNLEVLKLLGNTFEGERWEMEDDEKFPSLKFLKLDSLNVMEWTACADNFPRLKRLVLHKCEQLQKIPQDIGNIDTLEMIEVMWCSPSAATSAREIQEEQLDFGNEELKIHVLESSP